METNSLIFIQENHKELITKSLLFDNGNLLATSSFDGTFKVSLKNEKINFVIFGAPFWVKFFVFIKKPEFFKISENREIVQNVSS